MMSAVKLREDVLEVPLDTAARVADVSRRRLASWAERSLLRPSAPRFHGRRRVWGYGFEDLVLARIIRELEDRGVWIGEIHRIIDAARIAVSDGDITRLEWAASGGEAFVKFPDGNWYGGRQPNHARISGVLDLDRIRADTRRRIARPDSDAGRSERRRGTQGSREVFAGTRVPVDAVVAYVQAGRSDESILRSFPVLQQSDLELARERAGY